MTVKPTGLAAFTRKGSARPASPSDEAAQSEPAKKRSRAQGETVALTVRLSRSDWARLHQLAVAEGVSLQALALAGFSRVLADHGLPPLEN